MYLFKVFFIQYEKDICHLKDETGKSLSGECALWWLNGLGNRDKLSSTHFQIINYENIKLESIIISIYNNNNSSSYFISFPCKEQ